MPVRKTRSRWTMRLLQAFGENFSRAEVLDKAAILFASKGVAATSLKDVADAVGLRRSSIYYYYPSKDALLHELIQGATQPVLQIFKHVDAEGLSPLVNIRRSCAALCFGWPIPRPSSVSWTAAKPRFPPPSPSCTPMRSAMC